MAHPNEVMIRAAFEVFGRGDLDTLRDQYWTEDFRVHLRGRGPLSYDVEGHQDATDWFIRLGELTGGTYTAELHDVLANDEHVVALYTARAEHNGKSYQDDSVIVFTVRDGKIAEQWGYPADQYATDEFIS